MNLKCTYSYILFTFTMISFTIVMVANVCIVQNEQKGWWLWHVGDFQYNPAKFKPHGHISDIIIIMIVYI